MDGEMGQVLKTNDFDNSFYRFPIGLRMLRLLYGLVERAKAKMGQTDCPMATDEPCPCYIPICEFSMVTCSLQA